MRYLLILSILLLTITSCSSTKNVIEKTIWVNSKKADCVGVAPQKCLMIQENATIDPAKWEYLYNGIEGFNYEEGTTYKLKIKETHLPKEQVPADASSVKLSLVKILEQHIIETEETDIIDTNSLEGKWEVFYIKGVDKDLLDKQKPTLTVSGNRLSGFDGCNNYSTSLKKDLKNNEFGVSMIMQTKKMCPNSMEISNSYIKQLEKATQYISTDIQLDLLDENGEQVISFKPIQ